MFGNHNNSEQHDSKGCWQWIMHSSGYETYSPMPHNFAIMSPLWWEVTCLITLSQSYFGGKLWTVFVSLSHACGHIIESVDGCRQFCWSRCNLLTCLQLSYCICECSFSCCMYRLPYTKQVLSVYSECPSVSVQQWRDIFFSDFSSVDWFFAVEELASARLIFSHLASVASVCDKLGWKGLFSRYAVHAWVLFRSSM